MVDKKETTFSNIEIGQIFKLVDYFTDSLYIKIDYYYDSGQNVETSAVNLKTGDVIYIVPTDKVILISNAKIIY